MYEGKEDGAMRSRDRGSTFILDVLATPLQERSQVFKLSEEDSGCETELEGKYKTRTCFSSQTSGRGGEFLVDHLRELL